MGQERKFNTHEIIDTDPHEVDITQQYLNAVQEKKTRGQEESGVSGTEDRHEVVVYNQLPQSPCKRPGAAKTEPFTPRFSWLDKKYSKYYRITMAVWCTLTSALFGKYLGFKLDNLKYLNVLTILLVDAYFILSLFLYIPLGIHKTSENRLVIFLLNLYGLCFSLCLYLILCS